MSASLSAKYIPGCGDVTKLALIQEVQTATFGSRSKYKCLKKNHNSILKRAFMCFLLYGHNTCSCTPMSQTIRKGIKIIFCYFVTCKLGD